MRQIVNVLKVNEKSKIVSENTLKIRTSFNHPRSGVHTTPDFQEFYIESKMFLSVIHYEHILTDI